MNIQKLATIGILLRGSVSQLSGDRAATFTANAAAGKRRCVKVFQTALAGQPQLLPELSNFYCHPSRAWGSPWVISVAHHPYSCGARAEARSEEPRASYRIDDSDCVHHKQKAC